MKSRTTGPTASDRFLLSMERSLTHRTTVLAGNHNAGRLRTKHPRTKIYTAGTEHTQNTSVHSRDSTQLRDSTQFCTTFNERAD
jgi:hypothetical protein